MSSFHHPHPHTRGWLLVCEPAAVTTPSAHNCALAGAVLVPALTQDLSQRDQAVAAAATHPVVPQVRTVGGGTSFTAPCLSRSSRCSARSTARPRTPRHSGSRSTSTSTRPTRWRRPTAPRSRVSVCPPPMSHRRRQDRAELRRVLHAQHVQDVPGGAVNSAF